MSPEARTVLPPPPLARSSPGSLTSCAREFYPEVQVLENPVTHCALPREPLHLAHQLLCHQQVPRRRRSRPISNKNQASYCAAYTNWVIIDQFKTTDGLPLIDFKDPARSPILQMGLPRDKAIIKHPPVEGGGRRWIPIFDDPNDRRFRAAVDWILSLTQLCWLPHRVHAAGAQGSQGRRKRPARLTPTLTIANRRLASPRPGGVQAPGR